MLEDSDEDEDYEPPMHMDDGDDKDEKDVKTLLSPEDARNTGEIAEGVGRIKVCSLSFSLVSPVINMSLTITAQTSTLRRPPQHHHHPPPLP